MLAALASVFSNNFGLYILYETIGQPIYTHR